MWNDIIIGEGSKGNSAVKIRNYNNISENGNCFWITCDITKIGLTIFRDTDEAVELSKLIMNEGSTHEINVFILGVVLKRIDPEVILSKINDIKHASFKEGLISKQNEIQKVLGIY